MMWLFRKRPPTEAHYVQNYEIALNKMVRLEQALRRAEQELLEVEMRLLERHARIDVLNEALVDIIECETHRANATVKRMTRIAKEALLPRNPA